MFLQKAVWIAKNAKIAHDTFFLNISVAAIEFYGGLAKFFVATP